jgi:hypothetical protein
MIGGARFEQAPGPGKFAVTVSGSYFRKTSDNWFPDCGFNSLFLVADPNS